MTDWASAVASEAVKQGLDPAFAVAVMNQESGGNPAAVGQPVPGQGQANGLMQLMPATQQRFGVTNPRDPWQNIQAGVGLLRQNLLATGSMERAAAAYYGGIHNNYNADVHRYVSQVADRYNTLKDQYAVPPMHPQGQPMDQPTNPPPAGDQADQWLKTWAQGASPTQAAQQPDQPSPADAWLQQWSSAKSPDQQQPQGGPTRPLQEGLIGMGTEMYNAAKGAMGTSPYGLSDAQRSELQGYGVLPGPQGGGPVRAINSAVINTVAPWLDLAGRGVNALTSAAAIPVEAAGNAIGQAIDPAINAAGNAAGIDTAHGPLGPDLVQMPNALAGMPFEFVPPAMGNKLTGEAGANKIVGRVEPPVTNPAGAPESNATPMAEGAPASLSAAATPPEVAAMSPKELAAVDAQEALRRLSAAPPKSFDGTEYVPGSVPLKVEWAGNPNVAVEHRFLMNTNPEYRQGIENQLYQNNEARKDYFGQIAGDPVITKGMDQAARDQFEKNSEDILQNAAPANPQPVMDAIQGILKSRAGVDDTIKAKMKQVTGMLTDPETGQPYTNANMLYGVRQAISRMLSKDGAFADATNTYTSKQLMDIKNALDPVIEAAAPGYKQVLADYEGAMQPINAQSFLQSQLPSLVTDKGVMTAAKFKQMMTRIYNQRSMAGANDAKALSQDDMQGLWNIYSDLQRSNNTTLGMGPGSPTGQNVFEIGKKMAVAGARAKLAGVTGGTSELAIPMIQGAIKGRQTNKLVQEMLSPPPGWKE